MVATTLVLFFVIAVYLTAVALIQWVIAVISVWVLISGREPSSSQQGQEQITVVVPCHNEALSIERLLENLAAQTIADRLEVIIANDGSTDSTACFVRTWASRHPNRLKVTLIDLQRSGKGSAIDHALDRVQTRKVAILDADVDLSRDALVRLEEHLDTYPETVAASGWVVVQGPAEASLGARFLASMQAVEYARALIWRPGWQTLGALSIIEGRLGMFRTDILETARPFAAFAAAVDYNLSMRLVNAARRKDKSARLAVVWSSKVQTAVPTSFQSLARQRGRWLRGLLRAYLSQWRLVMNGNTPVASIAEFIVRCVTTPYPVAEMFLLPVLLLNLLISGSGPMQLAVVFASMYFLNVLLQVALAVCMNRTLTQEVEPSTGRAVLLLPIFSLVWEPIKMTVALYGALWYRENRAGIGWTPHRSNSGSRH